MASFRDGIDSAMGQLACSAARGYRTLTQNVPGAGLLLGGALPEIGSYLMERLYCPRDPYDRPFRPAPCPILYDVTVTWQITGHPSPQFNQTLSRSGRVYGPIGMASWERIEADEPGGRQVYRTFLVHNTSIQPPPGRPPFRQPWSPNGEFHELASLVILGVEAIPVNPAADNTCANDRVDIPYDPRDFTYNVDIDYNIDNGPTITIPFVGIIAPIFVNVRGELNMPVTFNIRPEFSPNFQNDFNFTANLNLTTGDTEIDWYGGNDPPVSGPPPALPPAPGPSPSDPPPPRPPDVPPASPDPDSPEPDRVIVGAIVTTTLIEPDASPSTIFQTGNPDLWVPSLGTVSFGIAARGQALGWTNDIPVKSKQAYLPCPVPTGAVRVEGTPRPGVEWTITPVFGPIPVSDGGG